MSRRHLGDTSKLNEINAALSEYRSQFDNRSRDTGSTWITTHGAIYDLVNLSCNIMSQMSTNELTCWNVLSDGTVEECPTETVGGKWVMYDSDGHVMTEFSQYSTQGETYKSKIWSKTGSENDFVAFLFGTRVPIPTWYMHLNNVIFIIDCDESQIHDEALKMMNVIDPNTTQRYTLRWTIAS